MSLPSSPVNPPRKLLWARAGDRYPDLADDLDYFIALDGGVEIGLVKWVETEPDHGWFWSMTTTHPGPPFKRPTWGTTPTRGQAARALGACYATFRAHYGIE